MLFSFSCQKENNEIQPLNNSGTKVSKSTMSENLDNGTKTSYATANVTLSSGTWTFNDALLGSSTSDRKNGTQAARVQNTGKLTMLFNKTNGAGTFSINHAKYGSDASSTWELYLSTNNGSTWTKVGNTITTSTTTLTSQSFTVNQSGDVRFEIRKISGGSARINFDDISISDYGTTPPAPTGVKILFDARKAESAGNADWVIDADVFNLGYSNGNPVAGSGSEANAQRIPTNAQSNITATTSENYWKGALSGWAIDCVKKGYTVETLPYNVSITYGNSSNPQDLSNYKVYVICEPNIVFTSAEKTAILQFVQNGGGLFMIADHDISDRNNDGWDSPHIWNDLMTNNSVKTNPFGFTFDYANFSQTTTNIPNLPSDPLLRGTMGNVTAMQFSNGTSLTLNSTANSTVKGIIYKSGSSFGNTNVMAAYCQFGSGKVVVIGDSSVADDGTGDTGDSLYNGYFAEANGSHRLLIMNATIWLANQQ